MQCMLTKRNMFGYLMELCSIWSNWTHYNLSRLIMMWMSLGCVSSFLLTCNKTKTIFSSKLKSYLQFSYYCFLKIQTPLQLFLQFILYLKGQELGSRHSQEASEFPTIPSSLDLFVQCNFKTIGERKGTWLFSGRVPGFTWEGELDGDETVRVEKVPVGWWRDSNVWEREKAGLVCMIVSHTAKRNKDRLTKN